MALSDIDNDGLLNSIESPVISAGTTITGDGNGDFIADAMQKNVNSIPTLGISTIPVEHRYVTFEVDPAFTLSNISNSSAPSSVAATQTLGVFDYRIKGLPVGGTAVVNLFTSTEANMTSLVMKNFVANALRTVSTVLTNVGGKNNLTFSLVDGGVYDPDRIANGAFNNATYVAPVVQTVTAAENSALIASAVASALADKQADIDSAVTTALSGTHSDADYQTVVTAKDAAETARDMAISDKNAGLAGVVSNLLGVDISASTGSVTFSKTKADYVGFDADKKITGNVLANKVTTGVNATSVSSSDGDDTVFSFAGNDTIDAGKGNDTINAADGNNKITAGAGFDSITAGVGDDKIDGGDDADTINAGDGLNTVIGGKGADSITAGNGNDKIDAGSENDTVDSGAGNDTVAGGAGSDSITAGAGDDKIDGGDDNDTINAGDGANTITGGKGADSITAGNGNDKIDSGSENDTVDSGAGNDTVAGGAGSDSITAGVGSDSVDGGADDDFIHGGIDNDTLLGGAGNDTINGGASNDKIDGGAGIDFLISGLGADTLIGGADSDMFVLGLDLTSIKTITDFKSTVDDLVLTDSLTPTELTASHLVKSLTAVFVFTDELPSFGYNTKTGALFYDVDGSGVGEQVQIALIANKAALVASDILI